LAALPTSAPMASHLGLRTRPGGKFFSALVSPLTPTLTFLVLLPPGREQGMTLAGLPHRLSRTQASLHSWEGWGRGRKGMIVSTRDLVCWSFYQKQR
jgi:hypothetical protein